ncbi:hypothetical protein [Pontibacterium sp.]|uniref:hypothetical protein n=1 Tax=Pontibacterium sp. TaxID=2036026 RepID=UPI003565DC5E
MLKSLWRIAFVSLLCVNVALAHNVVGGVYAIGATIEGEAGFSNGDMAKAGTPVLITNAAGQTIAEVLTDEEGFFVFEATQHIDHHFKLDMSSGHVLEMILPADELPASLPGGTPIASVQSNLTTPVSGSGLDAAALQQMVEKAVAKQVIPLRKELAAYKEKAGFQDLLGGIGYIFGLVGLGIWLRQRKQDKQQDKARASVS